MTTEPRMQNPAAVLPDIAQAVNVLYKAAHSAGVPGRTRQQAPQTRG
ncbi:hypothetical protein [Micromonospora halophytica]|uniref:Uncharacterized protein n=1 Tax=Micromonospora halophytica TaxID=47864 RepID=A0A1C5ISK1_9ACTN|nr:hypothetical protein [Micromonospora halophytica]SCG61348.1 hypothetical protein GA0070560_11628 [Micromonospora halophytica]